MNSKRVLQFIGTGLSLLMLTGIAFAGHGHGHGPHSPELDPGSLGSGLALLAGSGLLLVEKFRRRRSR